MTIKFLPAEEIERKADEVRALAACQSAPIDVIRIARLNQLSVYDASFPETDVSGMLQRQTASPRILVNKDHPYNRKRYTVAHELGHYFLHQGDFTDNSVDFYRHGPDDANDPSKKRAEIQANLFAAALLMPKDMIISAYRASQNAKVLADMFHVSEAAMNNRIASLEL